MSLRRFCILHFPLSGLLAASLSAQDVTGIVFQDRNGNGLRDPGEPGLAGVAVSDQDTVVSTDREGVFRITGSRGHGLVFVSVPSGYRVRGRFWQEIAEAVDGAAMLFALAPTPPARSFTFVHASDPHASAQSVPRLRRLRQMVDSIRPAFTIITGDLVRDALRVGEAEARSYYDLFASERDSFATPVHTAPGNHEIFGIEQQLSKVPPTHPLFGKAMYRSYFGPDYYSFNAGGVHFVALNTVDIHEGWYFGHVDSLQLVWLKRDLAALPAGTPVVTFNHIPFYSTADQLHGYDDGPPAPTIITLGNRTVFRHVVSNADSVLSVLAARRHVVALGGHVHIGERLAFVRDGQPTRFENSAAIVAPTQAGGRIFPSGFAVYSVTDGVVGQARFVRLP